MSTAAAVARVAAAVEVGSAAAAAVGRARAPSSGQQSPQHFSSFGLIASSIGAKLLLFGPIVRRTTDDKRLIIIFY